MRQPFGRRDRVGRVGGAEAVDRETHAGQPGGAGSAVERRDDGAGQDREPTQHSYGETGEPRANADTSRQTRHTRCRRPTMRRASLPTRGEPSSHGARPASAIGASAAADITAHAIPSPVNGSTYPAASPTANRPLAAEPRWPAREGGRSLPRGIGESRAWASRPRAGSLSPPGPSPPADFTNAGSNAAAMSSRPSSTRTRPTYPPRPVAM